MNLLLDYIVSNNTNYAYLNTNNIYNFIYEIIKKCESDEEKEEIKSLIKLHIGMSFYNNFISYCSRKGLL